jgi:hypothetical protein
MHLRTLERMLEEQHERDRRYGIAYDECDDFELELELADRIAEHASVPPGDPLCRALARRRLGLPGSPYEHPHEPPLRRYTEGDRVQHHHGDGPRPGRVVRTLDQEGLVEVDLGHEGTALVGIDEIEPEAA